MCAVGGADLDHVCTRRFHDVGHAKGTANLDQFATRDKHLAATRQREDREQHRGGVVVHDRGRLGTRQLAEQILDDAVAVAARARGEVVFKVGRCRHQRGDPRYRVLRQQGATQVGVDHGAGQVQDGAHFGFECGRHALGQPGIERIAVNRRH